jgi:esterase/lipase superfamily enzyme
MNALTRLDILRVFIAAGLALLLFSCASKPPRFIDLMPAPDVYSDDGITPFTDTTNIADAPYYGMLYATDRAPADQDKSQDPEEKFYANERGHLLRLGIADVTMGEGDFTWEEARKIAIAKNRTDKYPLKVTGIEEFGILDRSFTPFVDKALLAKKSPDPGKRFATLINNKLAISKQKDIFIYVHGYLVVFENPVLVATELWHYLGYEGVFIAYAWPSTPNRWAYLSDAETTTTTAFHLRKLLEFLAAQTNVRRIHILGYSQGTRLVTQTLYNMALMNHELSRQQMLEKLRIGNVILVGSDVDRQAMGTYLVDGLLKVPERLTIYASEKDKAMSASKIFLKRERVGEMFAHGKIAPGTLEFLKNSPELSAINVTEAEGAASGSGHGYFRSSPWTSSDILMTLRYDLAPAERGLVLSGDSPIWSFPPDYISRLREAIVKVNPELADRLQKQEGDKQ